MQMALTLPDKQIGVVIMSRLWKSGYSAEVTQDGRQRNKPSTDQRVWLSCRGSRPFGFVTSRFLTAFSIKHPQCNTHPVAPFLSQFRRE